MLFLSVLSVSAIPTVAFSQGSDEVSVDGSRAERHLERRSDRKDARSERRSERRDARTENRSERRESNGGGRSSRRNR